MSKIFKYLNIFNSLHKVKLGFNSYINKEINSHIEKHSLIDKYFNNFSNFNAFNLNNIESIFGKYGNEMINDFGKIIYINIKYL
jgi:hypothetical protein